MKFNFFVLLLLIVFAFVPVTYGAESESTATTYTNIETLKLNGGSVEVKADLWNRTNDDGRQICTVIIRYDPHNKVIGDIPIPYQPHELSRGFNCGEVADYIRILQYFKPWVEEKSVYFKPKKKAGS